MWENRGKWLMYDSDKERKKRIKGEDMEEIISC
jgi:hypothetical protein